jgi:hypothetical protein
MAEQTKSWPELAIGLYDRLTGRNATIVYEFNDMHVHVPSGTGNSGVEHAEWILSGKLRITTEEPGSPKS